MTTFHLTTTWNIPAPIETCWFSLLDLNAWPDWWKYVDRVIEVEPGESSGVNSSHKFSWSTCLPYQLFFELRTTQIIPYQLIRFNACGDLNGSGCCQLIQKDNVTTIQFEWDVQTSRPWMSFAGTFFQPIFEWNHRRVMKSGEQSLIDRLNVK